MNEQDYDPMQMPQRGAYKAPSAVHEKVVSTLRKEKDNIQKAFSSEKNARLKLEEATHDQSYQM